MVVCVESEWVSLEACSVTGVGSGVTVTETAVERGWSLTMKHAVRVAVSLRMVDASDVLADAAVSLATVQGRTTRGVGVSALPDVREPWGT